MKFTYEAYTNLIKKLQNQNYEFCDYRNYQEKKNTVILRHDIDISLEKALEMAKLERELGVSAYYFILLSTDFYNISSEKNINIIKKIRELGGKIGLHFDEKKYILKSEDYYINAVKYELEIMSMIIGEKIDVVSMHRPSKEFLEMNLEIRDAINSYQKKFFNDFKYVSDSRMHWRENIDEIIESQKYNQLHILTHPFWYSEKEETMQKKLQDFLDKAYCERYESLEQNIRNFKEIVRRKE